MTDRLIKLAEVSFECPPHANTVIRDWVIDENEILASGQHLVVPWNPIEEAAYEAALRTYRRPLNRLLTWLLRGERYYMLRGRRWRVIPKGTTHMQDFEEIREGSPLYWRLRRRGWLAPQPSDQNVDVTANRVHVAAGSTTWCSVISVCGATVHGNFVLSGRPEW